MASVHEVAYRLGGAMARELQRQEKAAIYGYGLEVILGETLKLVLLVTLSLALGIFSPVIMIFLISAAYRLISGGVHCSAYYRCLIAGLLVFLTLGGMVQWAGTTWPAYDQPLSILLGGYSLLVAWQRAPQAPPHKPMSEDKRQSCHRWSVALTTTMLPVLWFLPFYPVARLALAGGLAWQSFTLTRGGMAFLGGLDALLGVLNPWERRCLNKC